MKQALILTKKSNQQHGFTLVETAIAMGMVAVMISGFMIAFGPAVQGINKSISVKEASRLSSALELEMGVVRNGETYATAFDKAFWWIKQSTLDSKNPVLIYQYRGNPNSVRTDGTLNPYPYNAANPGIPGVNYVIQTSVRRLNDTFHNSKIQAELAPGVLEGKVYYVRMTQLRYDTDPDGVMVMMDTTSVNTISNLYPTHTTRATPALYTEDAVLPFRAKFYEVNPPLWSYVDATWSVANVGKPVYTRNMAVTR